MKLDPKNPSDIGTIQGGTTIKENESFPNKCDTCGSEKVMVTHLVTGILEPGEATAQKNKQEAIDKAARQGAETMANALLKH